MFDMRTFINELINFDVTTTSVSDMLSEVIDRQIGSVEHVVNDMSDEDMVNVLSANDGMTHFNRVMECRHAMRDSHIAEGKASGTYRSNSLKKWIEENNFSDVLSSIGAVIDNCSWRWALHFSGPYYVSDNSLHNIYKTMTCNLIQKCIDSEKEYFNSHDELTILKNDIDVSAFGLPIFYHSSLGKGLSNGEHKPFDIDDYKKIKELNEKLDEFKKTLQKEFLDWYNAK